MRITQQTIELRNRDIHGGTKLVTDYENMRRKNLCILFSIGAMLFLALFYIIFSNISKYFD